MYTVRREQPQIGKNSVLTDKPQRALLLLPQGDIFLCEKALRILKGQFLIQGTGRLIVIAVHLLIIFKMALPVAGTVDAPCRTKTPSGRSPLDAR